MPTEIEPSRHFQVGSAGIKPVCRTLQWNNAPAPKGTRVTDESRFKKRLYTSAVALGLVLGSVGIAAAATGPSREPGAPAEEATEVEEPAYIGSVEAPAEDESLTEAEEAAQLEGLAGITADEAAAAAAAAVGGDVTQVELDNENGTVVYSVEIADAAGVDVDVKVDAGDGAILDQQADDDAGEDDEADDDDVQNENEQEGEHENDHED